jgi:DNA-binding transcriptional MerR regulator
MNDTPKRARVTRSEAARILQTTYDNVRYLERRGRLTVRGVDPDGVKLFDRHEVEKLASTRRIRHFRKERKAEGELHAAVFKLFKAGKSFEDVVIETNLKADEILVLWDRYKAGFNYRPESSSPEPARVRSPRPSPPPETEEQRREREHQEQMRELDIEFERHRRRVHGSK